VAEDRVTVVNNSCLIDGTPVPDPATLVPDIVD
jgi:hypothetical protein